MRGIMYTVFNQLVYTPLQEAQEFDAAMRTLSRVKAMRQRLLGKGLHRLTRDGGLKKLGMGSLGNYSLQQLGMHGNTAHELATVERYLENRPVTESMYEDGRLNFSQVLQLVRKVKAEDEAVWAELAVNLSVVELKEALKS